MLRLVFLFALPALMAAEDVISGEQAVEAAKEIAPVEENALHEKDDKEQEGDDSAESMLEEGESGQGPVDKRLTSSKRFSSLVSLIRSSVLFET